MEEMIAGNIVELIDEEGNTVRFDLLMTFDYEGKRYASLLPVDEVDGVGEDEVVLLEIVKNGTAEDYVPIENPVLLEEVFDAFTELFEEEIGKLDEETDK